MRRSTQRTSTTGLRTSTALATLLILRSTISPSTTREKTAESLIYFAHDSELGRLLHSVGTVWGIPGPIERPILHDLEGCNHVSSGKEKTHQPSDWIPIHSIVQTCTGITNNSLTGSDHRATMNIQNTRTIVA